MIDSITINKIKKLTVEGDLIWIQLPSSDSFYCRHQITENTYIKMTVYSIENPMILLFLHKKKQLPIEIDEFRGVYVKKLIDVIRFYTR